VPRARRAKNPTGAIIQPEDRSPSMLEVDDLSIAFGSTRVLDGLSFRVQRGEYLAIIGPNGGGKTVLFQVLVGALPFRGQVRWAPGTRIGYVPQKLAIERDLPITGLDLLAAKHRVTKSRDDLVALVRRVGLDREPAQPIGTLSGGQFQRLLIALALLGDPHVLLLDEFTAGVDAPGQGRLTELVRRLQVENGLTILSISHDLGVARRSATNVLCLAHARAWFGPPKKILTPEALQEAFGTNMEFHIHDE
jgi:zinc transport system ATP-binding protein